MLASASNESSMNASAGLWPSIRRLRTSWTITLTSWTSTLASWTITLATGAALAGLVTTPASAQTRSIGTQPAATAAHSRAVRTHARSAPLRTYHRPTVTLRTDTEHSYATALLTKLESFVAQANHHLARILAVPRRNVAVTIVVFESQERYQRYARKHAPGLVNNGGYYDGSSRTVVTYRFNNSMQLYFHELVHAMMAEHFGDHHFSRYTRKQWPIWFDEGMSEYLGSYAVDGDGLRIPAPNKGKLAYLANAMQHRAFVSLPALLQAPASGFSGVSMNIFYAESWGLVDFLVNHPKHSLKVPLFFRKIRAGEPGLTAFRACFGSDLGQFETMWRAHIAKAVLPPKSVWLFSGESIDDWTVHEGGRWRVHDKQIVGSGNRNYNYLIKSEVPMGDFHYELDVRLDRGTAGLILGNNYHGEYPYYYLIDVARDAVMLRRSYTATRIEPVKQAFADIAMGKWIHLDIRVEDRTVSIAVDGRTVLSARSDRASYSLFGLYLYHARARFKNIRVHRLQPRTKHFAKGRRRPFVRPAGAGTSISPRGPASPLVGLSSRDQPH